MNPATTPILPGLCSITLKGLSPSDILRFLEAHRLGAVEWWGGEHIAPGDTVTAHEIGRQCRDAGLWISSYGSYYRCGVSEHAGLPFSAVLDSAEAMGAPTIRVWAGYQDLKDCSEAKRQDVLDDSLRIADLAAGRGNSITFEFHGGTLTDRNESAAWLAAQLPHDAIFFSWQPPHGFSKEHCLDGLRTLLPRLSTVHVYQWTIGAYESNQFNADERSLKWPDDFHRHPLSDGEERWPDYLKLAATTGRRHAALLEFVRGDSIEQAEADAATLVRWCQNLTTSLGLVAPEPSSTSR